MVNTKNINRTIQIIYVQTIYSKSEIAIYCEQKSEIAIYREQKSEIAIYCEQKSAV